MRFSRLLLPLVGITALFAAPHAVQAQTFAYTVSGGVSNTAGSDLTLGQDITFASAVTITDIGVWVGGTTSSAGRGAGIFDLSGTLLAGVTLPGGGANDGDFLMAPLSSSLFVPAGTYRIAAFYAGSDFGLVNPTIIPAGGVTMGGYFLNGSGSLIFPTSSFGTAVQGANVKFTTSSAAPEPGTLALLALGGSLALVKRRRK